MLTLLLVMKRYKCRIPLAPFLCTAYFIIVSIYDGARYIFFLEFIVTFFRIFKANLLDLRWKRLLIKLFLWLLKRVGSKYSGNELTDRRDTSINHWSTTLVPWAELEWKWHPLIWALIGQHQAAGGLCVQNISWVSHIFLISVALNAWRAATKFQNSLLLHFHI